MYCLENISNITGIEAWPWNAVTPSVLYTFRHTMKASSFNFSGKPVVLLVKELTGQAECGLEHTEAGPIYQLSLTWETADASPEVLEQVSALENEPFHFVLFTEDGSRKLVYNWNGIGKLIARDEMSGEDRTITLSIAFRSRIPLLTLIP